MAKAAQLETSASGRIAALSLLVTVATSCSGQQGGTPAGCTAQPLATPSFDITGPAVSEATPQRWSGEIDHLSQSGSSLELVVSGTTIRIDLTQPTAVDLTDGRVVDVAFWERQGFEGTARGIRVDDADGQVLVVEDGDYGNAISPDDLLPFQVSQIDIGCRNRANEGAGTLNNFALAVSSEDSSVQLVNAETATLSTGGRNYSVSAQRSVAAVDDAFWTDAPYQYTSFVLARTPDD